MTSTVSDLIGEKKTTVYAIPSLLPLIEASRKMVAKQVGCLIIKKGPEYVGLLTDRDITKSLAKSEDILKLKAEDAMKKEICFVAPDDTLEYTAQVMRKLNIRHIPVFDGESIIHVVSIRDIAFSSLADFPVEVKLLKKGL